ncbi:acetyl-CoA carboxylase, carboxyltransferase subunit beta, partial [Vibrio alfacsensis]
REMRQRVGSLLAKMTNKASPLVVSVEDSPEEPTYEVPEADEKG